MGTHGRSSGSGLSRVRIAVMLAIGSLAATAEAGAQLDASVLTFEADGAEGGLHGWRGAPPGTVHIDSSVVKSGRFAGRIQRGPDADGSSSILSLALPIDFRGETVTLRGWLRTEGVVGEGGFAGLWLRQDGPSGFISIDNMQDQELSGSTEWSEYAVTIELHADARRLVFGALLPGAGTVWVDDLELLVDDQPVSEAPAIERVPTAIELDTEFDDGSGITSGVPTATQVDNLALLARVWGFLRYHHPVITGGERHWNYDLFRVLPDVLAAASPGEARSVIETWALELGEPDACGPCATVPANAYFTADLEWIENTNLIGRELSRFLVATYRNRSTDPEQAYVSHNPGVGNPVFGGESAYAEISFPDAGYRLLALFDFWNIIEYWFPYRDILDDDWTTVLAEYIPRMMQAQDRPAYELAMMEVIARVDDTHANLWSSLAVRPPVGDARIPVLMRFVEDELVVTGFLDPDSGPASGLRVGDVIEVVDGAPVDSLVEAWRPYYAASNQPTRLRDVARGITRGPAGFAAIAGRRGGSRFEMTVERVPESELDMTVGRWHDRPGPAFQRLDEAVAYLKLSSVRQADVPAYLEGAEGAEVLVVDIRNYPSEFMPFALGSHFVAAPTEFARFTRAEAANPGAFVMGPSVTLQPSEPRFEGRVVILIDAVSQSQSEYTTMAFRAAPNAIVVGSTTAGADGNVSSIPLPGGLRAMITGIGVFYPDGSPTQRIGIVPDVFVTPTLAGIREGRDEVLEAGVSRALGRTWTAPDRR